MSKAALVFDKAKTLYDGVGDKRGKADALKALAKVTSDQEDPATVKKLYEEAAAIYREIGDKAGLSNTLNGLGVWQKNRGNPKAARKLYEESVALSHEIGDRRGEGIGLFNSALLHWNDPGPGPMPLYRKTLGIFEELGYKDGQASVLNEMGVWADDRGRLQDALAIFEKDLAPCREMGSQGGQAFALGNRADVLFNLGRLSEAKKSLEDAIAIDSALNLPGGAVGLRNGLAKVLYHMGDFKEARAEFEGVAAFLLQQASRDSQYDAAVSRLGLAALDLEDGRFAEVEATLRGIAGQYATEKDAGAGVLASITLAKCLLRERKYKESQAAINGAEALRRSMKTDAWPEFVREIAILRAEARSQGFYGFELQARLAAGQIELKSGRSAAARQELMALADEARVREFGLIARWAAEAAN